MNCVNYYNINMWIVEKKLIQLLCLDLNDTSLEEIT